MYNTSIQFQIAVELLEGGEGSVTQIAKRLLLKPNTTIRNVLETFVFVGVVKRRWDQTSARKMGWIYEPNFDDQQFWGDVAGWDQ